MAIFELPLLPVGNSKFAIIAIMANFEIQFYNHHIYTTEFILSNQEYLKIFLKIFGSFLINTPTY